MMNLKKTNLATMSEPAVNCAPPHMKPSKRVKKSKISTNVESDCPTFSRSPLQNDTPKDKQALLDSSLSADESVLYDHEGNRTNVIRKRLALDDTTRRLFGSHAKPQTRQRRRWELDTYTALFGPEGQIMMSEKPRHYDIFELHRDMRIRQRKQLQDSQSELFNRPAWGTRVEVSRDRLFGDITESEPTDIELIRSQVCELHQKLRMNRCNQFRFIIRL